MCVCVCVCVGVCFDPLEVANTQAVLQGTPHVPSTPQVGSSNSIRTNLNEQLAKLALKQNAELNLLENFRCVWRREE